RSWGRGLSFSAILKAPRTTVEGRARELPPPGESPNMFGLKDWAVPAVPASGAWAKASPARGGATAGIGSTVEVPSGTVRPDGAAQSGFVAAAQSAATGSAATSGRPARARQQPQVHR